MRDRLLAVNWVGIAVIAGVLAVWQLADAVGLIRLDYVRPPSEIAVAIAGEVANGDVWLVLGHTVGAVLISWIAALVVGVALGIVLGLSRVARTWTMSSVQVFRTLPAVALVPVALLIVGFSINAEILVAAYVALWPVVISTAIAIRSAHPRLREVAALFNLSKRETVQKLLLPSAWPELVVAARLALTIALVLVVVTEMVGNPAGLGYALVSAQQALQPAEMWAYLFITGLVGMVLQALLTWGARRALPGHAPRISTGAR